jgi:hypothetical protein
MKENQLIYLKHSEIDYLLWDERIENASNSRVYAATWYLDRTAITWDALVWGHYEFVMPLPVKQKLGIKYLYQPLFCQQLGIFPTPSVSVAEQFYSELMRLFKYSDIQLNSFNLPSKTFHEIEFLPRNNFLLHLGTEFKILSEAYSENTRRNIARAEKNQLNFVEGIPMDEYLRFKQSCMSFKFSKTSLQKLKSIIAFSQYKGMAEITGVYSAGNELCAAVFFCRWKDRLIYMNAASTKEGKDLRAMFLLIDRFVKASAGKNLLLDFEGSMLPGVARFFDGFGAMPEVYYRLKFNRLPVFLRWFK